MYSSNFKITFVSENQPQYVLKTIGKMVSSIPNFIWYWSNVEIKDAFNWALEKSWAELQIRIHYPGTVAPPGGLDSSPSL